MKNLIVASMAILASSEAVSAQEITLTLEVGAESLRSGAWRDQASGAAEVTVRLRSDVTAIPERAFADCLNLVRVECAPGSRLHKVGAFAFRGCLNLQEVTLPSTVTVIGERAFLECESLRQFDMPAGVTVVPSHCFEWCKSLERVGLSNRLTKISSAAFIYCFSLKEIALPSSLTSVGSNAFTECRSLERLDIPNGVTSLGSYIASGCISLRSATLPSGAKEMGELMFSGCRKLESLKINKRVAPKFECNSYIFEPEESELYSHCHLIVPAPDSYRRAHGWKLFQTIVSE